MNSSKDAYGALAYFAAAVEIDELGCRWRKKFEKRLEKLGDLFSMPPRNDDDKYCSLLSEAYLVMLLHTVVSEQGGQTADLEEDYQLVKSRLDACVNLRPDNPMVRDNCCLETRCAPVIYTPLHAAAAFVALQGINQLPPLWLQLANSPCPLQAPQQTSSAHRFTSCGPTSCSALATLPTRPP